MVITHIYQKWDSQSRYVNCADYTRSLSGIGSLEARINNLRATPVCKLLILGCRLLIPDRLLGYPLC